jgi:hypothetical protein
VTRRSGSGVLRRPGLRGGHPATSGGGAPPVVDPIDLATAGTFGRASAVTYHNGSLATLLHAASGARALEDRNDTAGALLRICRAYTQYVARSEELSNAGWVKTSATVTADQGAAPDGDADADLVTWTATSVSARATGACPNSGTELADNAAAVYSIFVKDASGDPFRLNYTTKANGSGTASSDFTPSGTWARYDYRVADIGAGATDAALRFQNASSSGIRAYDLVWGGQMTAGRYPLPYATNTGATELDIAADSLVIASGTDTTNILGGALKFDEVSPYFANTELASGDVRWLWTLDANNGIRIRHTGSDVRVEAVESNTVRASSAALTFAAHALLGEIEWDPAAGTVSVGGAAGAAGTPWTWNNGDVRIGGIQGGSGSEADCRFGDLVAS